MPLDTSFGSRLEVDGLSKAWRSRSYAEQEEDVERLIRSSHELQVALRSAKAIISGASKNKFGSSAIQAAEVQSAAIDGILHMMIETKYFNYQHGHTSTTTAADFFDVAEVCERVLMDLPIVDVLAMQQAKKRAFAIIEGSPKLQRKLHLLPEPDALPYALRFRPHVERSYGVKRDANLANLEISFSDPFRSHTFGPGFGEHTVHIRVDAEDYLKRPGTTIRKMLLCQPPVTELHVEVSCCGDTSMGPEEYVDADESGRSPDYGSDIMRHEKFAAHGKKLQKLRREAGVTVGDVYDICVELAKKHQLCPGAGASWHDRDGIVRPACQFYGPLEVQYEEEDDEEKDMREDMEVVGPRPAIGGAITYWGHRERIQRYMRHKEDVAVLGTHIPTLAEFEKLSAAAVEEIEIAAEEERSARREAMYASWRS